jgi:hypothetical protein
MNYGETLTYWYLRLNGFIPMRNFVLHRADLEARQSADTDLLAVRFPHVYEEIGGKPEDWDEARFTGWGLNLARHLAFIVEVKTGQVDAEIISWRPKRLATALRRLGMFEEGQVPGIVEPLGRAATVDVGAWTVAKVLVTGEPPPNGHWLSLTLAEADTFIANRITKYRIAKVADRLRFPDDLMQYLAWKP